MKKLHFFIFSLLINLLCVSQTTDGFKYQAVIRDATGNVNASAAVSLEIAILQTSPDGTTVFSETHDVTSNAYGLVNLTIGSQNPSSFDLIDWSNGPYFIKILVDGVEFGTSQLMSVPFAMHAKTAESVNESDPLFSASPVSGITAADMAEWSNKIAEYTETDPLFETSVAKGITQAQIELWTNKLDEFIEADPIYNASLAKGITAIDTAYWNSKLDEFVEADPNFMAHPAAGITAEDITKWQALFIWYTTNSNGYLKTETDPVFGASVAKGITAADTAAWNANSGGSGATEINELSDAKTDESSIFLGTNAGANDDGNNYNIAIGKNNLTSNTSGRQNIAIGHGVLVVNSTGMNNTAVGDAALYINSTGGFNTAYGSSVLRANTTGNYNNGNGYVALFSNTTGYYNIASGSYSLYKNTTGSSNIGMGYNALYNNVVNSGSIAIGYEAMMNADNRTSLPQTTYNTAIGYQALKGGSTPSSNSGTNNTAIGGRALTGNTNGGENTAIGSESLMTNTTGGGNTAVGYRTLPLSNGDENSAFGKDALRSNTTGDENLALGFGALRSNTTGNYNVSTGYQTLYYNELGSNNVAIGWRALMHNGGSGNIGIGNYAGASANSSNKLYIDNTDNATPLIYGDFAVDSIRINGVLDVSDNIKIEGGSPGAGKVLTSDASGLASWETVVTDTSNILQDADGDTKIELESNVDSDDIKITLGGTYSWYLGISHLAPMASGGSVFIGEYAGYSDDLSNNDNTFIGYGAGYANTTGSKNVAIGSESSNYNKSGSNNVILGYGAGYGIENNNQSGNVMIGYQAGYSETASNKLYIENSNSITPLIYGDFTEDSVRVNGTLDIKETIKIEGGNPGEGKILTSDASGNANWESAIAVKAVQSTPLALAANTTKVMEFEYEMFDTGNYLSNGVFTAPADGFYQVNVSIYVARPATEMTVLLRRNGWPSAKSHTSGGTSKSGTSLSDLVLLLAGQSLTVEVTVDNATSTTDATENQFSVGMIR